MKELIIKAFNGLFVHQLTISRQAGKLQIRLIAPEKRDASEDALTSIHLSIGGGHTPSALPPALSDVDLQRIRLALKQTLAKDRRAGTACIHLIYAERILRTTGLAGLHNVPTRVLQSALKQMDMLLSLGQQADLQRLRDCLGQVLSGRSKEMEQIAPDQFLLRELSIKEGTWSDFVNLSVSDAPSKS